MANILILGAGAMGTAFSFPAADAGHTVRLVGTHLDLEWINSLRKIGLHPKLKVKLPNLVSPFSHDQLGEALSLGNDLIVLGVNSAGVRWAVEQLGPLITETTPILMLTKGLRAQGDAIQILPYSVRDGLADYGIKNVPIGAIAGPCIASELAAGRDTTVVVAYAEAKLLEWTVRLLTTSYYHVRPSMDIVGIEVCAALKNFYALAIGYPAGRLAKQEPAPNRALMHNPAAALFAEALIEMAHLVSFLGGDQSSVTGLAGAGDLYVTCQAGRNSRTGYLLGSGLRYSEVKANHMANETVEGAELAFVIGPVLDRLFSHRRLDPKAFPLATAITDAICRDLPMRIPWSALPFSKGVISQEMRKWSE
jgi:glycerol-3-phosphate dehydrogenase (NAD(P)+)